MFRDEFIMPGKSAVFFRYKGGGGGYEPNQPRPSDYEKERVTMLRPMLTDMLGGGGLNFAMNYQGYFNPARQKRQLQKGIDAGRLQLASDLGRTVKTGDTKVRDFASRAYEQSALASKQDLQTRMDLQKESDREMAQAMATDIGAAGKQMGVGVLDIYNRGNAANTALLASGGDMTTNIASGVGSMAGWMMAGQDYAQRMSNEKQTV